MRRRAIARPMAAALMSVGSLGCALLAGLEDHELAPPSADAAPSAEGSAAVPCEGGAGTACGGACVDLATSHDHCGRCARACGGGYACANNECGNDVVGLSASSTNACAVLRAGEVWCWGKNQFGAAGVAPSPADAICGGARCRPTPARVDGLADVAQVAVGLDYACAAKRDGSVFCWGINAHGNLGHDPKDDRRCDRPAAPDGGASATDPCSPIPTRVPLPDGALAQQVAASNDATCVRTRDKDVYCWGNNVLGVVGVAPHGGDVAQPTRLAGINRDADDLSLSGAYSHGCVLRVLGSVFCWGMNHAGQLGHAPSTNGDVPGVFGIPVNTTPRSVPGIGGKSVAAGQGTTCLLTHDLKIACWGANDYGQLGNGSGVDGSPHPTPAVIAGLPTITRVEIRHQTGFALDGDAKFWAWGSNAGAAMGLGVGGGIACAQGRCKPKPEVVPELARTVEIAGAGAGGLARGEDGSVLGWGANDLGQLGHAPGTAGDADCDGTPCSARPTRVTGLP